MTPWKALDLKWLIIVVLSRSKEAEPLYVVLDSGWVWDTMWKEHDLGLGSSLQLRQITKWGSA